MCLGGSPDIPKPQPVQEAKQPDSVKLYDKARKNRAGIVGGSLLTGPSGVAPSAVSTGTTSLLGG